MNKKSEGIKVVARNRSASHNYALGERFEAGVVLNGAEIKSIRASNINITDGFVQEANGELWLYGVHVTPYKQASKWDNLDPMRPRKLLLHKKEIARLITQTRERGYTIVPTMVYLKNGRAKIEIAIARGKKQYDKRDSISKRESDRQIQRALKDRYD
jgi:SsrA-binding protein